MPFPFQVQRFVRLLQKKLGLIGFINATLVEDVQPVVTLLTGDAPEDYFLRDERRWGRVVNSPAVAGNLSFVALGNPPGSGQLVVIDALRVTGAGALGAGVGMSFGTATSGGGILQPADTRLGQAPLSQRHVANPRTGSNLVAFLTVLYDLPPTNERVLYGLVLAPGDEVFVEGNNTNTALQVAFNWREYGFAPQELTSG